MSTRGPALAVLARAALAATLLSLAATPAAAQQPAAACAPPGSLECPTFLRHVNHKYGFSVDVPAFLVKKPADADGRGQTFELGSRVRVRAWAMYDNPPMTVQQLFGDWTRRDGITFKSLTKNAWVVRGHEGQRLFYTRSILADGLISTIEVSYEPEVALAIEPILARMGATLVTIPGEGLRGKTH